MDYYVDPAAGGANDGGGDGVANDPTDTDNWTDAWVSIQSAYDTAVADDVVYCRGTQTLTVTIDVDINNGDNQTGLIRFIGVEGLLGNTGTRFILDGNSVAVNCIHGNNIDFVYHENFEFKNATGDGVESSNTSLNWVFINCSANNNGGHGFDGIQMTNPIYIRCTAYANSTQGFNRGASARMLFCSSHDNTGDGYDAIISGGAVIGSLFYDNGDKGIENLASTSSVFNCVINGNTGDGISIRSVASGAVIVIEGNRITNHSGVGDIGLNCNGETVLHGWNYYEDNDGANIQNAAFAIEILDDGAGTDVEDQADTNEGYTDKTDGAEDFKLRSDATSRRTAITIPTV